ncbi:MAG: PaaI family thioesterase [Bacteroidales bacterium]|nr:PaaI family thioesterase [Bacteroidales bacterium]
MTNLTLRARQVFAQDLYATQATGVVIDAVEPRHARCSVQLTPLLRNAMGAVMGGVMFTLADLAFAAAANSECIEQDEPLAWVTTGSSIEYLSQPADHTLTAETQCIKQGRTTCLYLVHITDGTGRAVAMLTTRGVKLATSPTA